MNFLDRLIRFSLAHRGLVLTIAGLCLLVGGTWLLDRPLDIFPDLSAPTVTLVTEAPGMAPEEVETLVTLPIEAAINGASGIRRLRSISADGISVIFVEFDWDVNIYRARQTTTERLQRVVLPERVLQPELGPISSVMGEITFVALTVDSSSPREAAAAEGDTANPTSLGELRRLADVVVRRNLLSVPGISRVVAIGGDQRQLQVTIRPADLARARVTLAEVLDAAGAASASPAAGFHVESDQEYLVRGLGRTADPAAIAETVVALRGEGADRVPIHIGDVADVAWGAAPARGTAGYNLDPAVILSVQKQPDANTLELTETIDEVLRNLESALPDDVILQKENFRQADFIELAMDNVKEALRDGAILVILVLFIFLGSWRTTLISALAIPLSLIAGVVTVTYFGGSLNTMTLGGLTIAIGALVDDAIIDVENVFRRLRLERALPRAERRSALEVVFHASSEVRKAILYATLVIVLAFLPLFWLPGLEGRLLRPLGLAYVSALVASLFVSLTVTPVLCALLLPQSKEVDRREPWLLRRLHAGYRPALDWALRRGSWVVAASLLGLAASLLLLPGLGRSFLPDFNEGALTVSVTSAPGIPLDESDRLGRQVEAALHRFPEVLSTSRRTGRAERDEHVQGVNSSELEVVLEPAEGRSQDELLAAMRHEVAQIPGVSVAFGQPISHRIEHMISGSKTNLAVKIFGPEIAVLRSLGAQVRDVLDERPGIVDLSNQEQASVPQLLVDFDRPALARFGLRPADLADTIDALFQGAQVGEVVEDGLVSSLVVRYPESLRRHRERLVDLPVTAPSGAQLRLGDVARLRFDLAPSLLRRENVQRVAMVTANVSGTDLVGTVDAARDAVAERVDLPPGYLIVFDGQFEESNRSLRRLSSLAVGVLFAMYGLLFAAFGTHRETLVVLVNLPLALIGGLVAVALGGGVLSLATVVGFVALFGIATRNGVLLVSHYQHLRSDEGLAIGEAVVRGSRERLAPILMTALTAGLALVPLVARGGEPGNEIQSPMGQVILGGLVTSTLLNIFLVPVLYRRWAPPGALAQAPEEGSNGEGSGIVGA